VNEEGLVRTGNGQAIPEPEPRPGKENRQPARGQDEEPLMMTSGSEFQPGDLVEGRRLR
jgi:hypothetical protein